MKIKAELTEKGASITCAIAIPELEIPLKPINFLLDTGATKTMLCEVEANKLEIDFSKLKKSDKPIVSMGGVSESFIINNVIIILDTDSGAKEFEMVSILISRFPKRSGRKRGKKSIAYMKALPNLFGRDFFKKYKMRLIVDFEKNEAYLEC